MTTTTRRSIPQLFLILIAAFATLAAPLASEACSCIHRSASDYLKSADLVFLARAGKETGDAKTVAQPLTVLQALKGEPGPVYIYGRSNGAMTSCATLFKEGAVALVFVKAGEITTCSGNYALSVQMEWMKELAVASGLKGEPTLDVVKSALVSALTPYLHKRKRVVVGFGELAGQSGRLNPNVEIIFKEAPPKEGVRITESASAGRMHLLKGRYYIEGVGFLMLMVDDEVVYKRVWEQ